MFSIQLVDASENGVDSTVHKILNGFVFGEWEIKIAIPEGANTRTPVCLVSSEMKEHVQFVLMKVMGWRKATIITNSESCVVSK